MKQKVWENALFILTSVLAAVVVCVTIAVTVYGKSQTRLAPNHTQSSSANKTTAGYEDYDNLSEDTEGEDDSLYNTSMNSFAAKENETTKPAKKSKAKKNKKTSKSAKSSNVNYIADNPEYILPDSASAYYKKKDIKNLSAEEVQLARNEIYARHGRRFDTEWIADYFYEKSWYHPSVDEVSDQELNKYEIANRNMMVKYEKDKGWK